MATPEEIEIVRDMINTTEDDTVWTEEKIGMYIDLHTNLNKAAGNIWLVKAGSFAQMVNVSESGSSRSLGSLHANALALSKYYLGLAASEEQAEATLDAPFTVAIRRK